MNNEEKILSILDQLQSGLSEVKTDLAGVKTDLAGVKVKLDQVDERSRRTAVLLETEYKQKLDMLYEGHQAILETLTPRDRFEEVEADITVLKMAVRTLTAEVAELKRVP